MNIQKQKCEIGFGQFTIVVFLLLFGWVSLCEANQSLTLVSGSWRKTFSLQELKKKMKVTELSSFDHVYKRNMTFEGFLLEDVLSLFESPGEEIVFTAEDGFSPTMLMADYKGKRAIIAFGEKGKNGGWSEFQAGKTRTTPAPFYLFWKDGTLEESRYPRPYKLVKIELISLKKKFPKIFPAESVSHDVVRGFVIFKQHCLMCHSMNLQGGEVGPELNVPKNITEYRDAVTLKKFIRSASSFRAKSKMPDFPQLTNRDLDGLMSYLKYMRGHKNSQ